MHGFQALVRNNSLFVICKHLLEARPWADTDADTDADAWPELLHRTVQCFSEETYIHTYIHTYINTLCIPHATHKVGQEGATSLRHAYTHTWRHTYHMLHTEKAKKAHLHCVSSVKNFWRIASRNNHKVHQVEEMLGFLDNWDASMQEALCQVCAKLYIHTYIDVCVCA